MRKSIKDIKYALHVQNPYNLNEFDDYDSDQPFQPFAVGQSLRSSTFESGSGKSLTEPPTPVVGVWRSISSVGDTTFDETWVITDVEWLERHSTI
jgi:hypothetical protein